MITRTALALSLVLGLAAAGTAGADSQPFKTVDQGAISGYRWEDPTFVDGDWFVISDDASWALFWALHESIFFPPRELPAIDFTMEDVVVDLQGFRPSPGFWTTVVDIDVTGLDVNITVVHRGDGFVVEINPFHIVRTAKFPADATVSRTVICEPFECPPLRDAEALSSKAKRLPRQPITVTGTLVVGEITGFGIITEGMKKFELIFGGTEESSEEDFEEGKTARVTGFTTHLQDRPAIKVTDMLVCPDPGTGVDCLGLGGEGICLYENLLWVEAHCPDVSFSW